MLSMTSMTTSFATDYDYLIKLWYDIALIFAIVNINIMYTFCHKFVVLVVNIYIH